MTSEVKLMVNKTVENPCGFNRVFINNENELIVSPYGNAYFRLEDVETELDFKCKVLEWLSYYCADNHWYDKYDLSAKMENMINYLLGTHFTHKDYQCIYCKLGNRVNHTLTIQFIESGYDIEALQKNGK